MNKFCVILYSEIDSYSVELLINAKQQTIGLQNFTNKFVRGINENYLRVNDS